MLPDPVPFNVASGDGLTVITAVPPCVCVGETVSVTLISV